MHGLCYTCLSKNRNVKTLDNFSLKSILSEWFDVAGNFKSEHVENLSKLSIYTKTIYDNTYKHVEESSGLNTLQSKSLPDDMKPRNESEIPKKKDTQNPDNGRHKLSITLRKNKETVIPKISKHSNYDSYEIKENSTGDNTDDTDSNDKEKDTPKHDGGELGLSSILNVTDLSEDVKLRSQPFVLLEREKHKKDSNHSKHKHRKRKHEADSDEVEKEKAKKHKQTEATAVGPNTTKAGPKSTKPGPKCTKVGPKSTKVGPKCSKVGPDATKVSAIATNVGPIATEVGPIPTNVVPKTTNVDPNAGTSGDAAHDSSDSTSDLPEVKFTIVHLTEEQMLKAREIDRNDRLYVNRAFKCQTCIIGFLEIVQFEKHNKEKHSVLNGSLVCRVCDTRFKRHGILELHQNSHYRGYRCRLCSFQHHRRYVIETHVVKDHGLKPSPVCSDCDMEFDTQKLLMTHYEIAHKETLKCNVLCGETFDTYARVRDHAPNHKECGEDCKRFHCAPCDSIFEGKAKYRAHMQYAHVVLAETAYCADCDIQFPTTHELKQHFEQKKKHALLVEKSFGCAHCILTFLTEETLLVHVGRSHRLLSHSCALCSKGFSDQIRLKNHIQVKHPEVIPIKIIMDKICQICGEKFFARSCLLEHMRSHTAEKPYQCKTCEKRFAVEPLLKKHIQRMHQRDDH